MRFFIFIFFCSLFSFIAPLLLQGQNGEEFDGVACEEGQMVMQRARQQIEQIRKGDFTLKLVDEEGHPIKGRIVIRQKQHEFPFGAAISPTLLYTSGLVKQRAMKIAEELFNTVTINCMWGQTQATKGGPYDFSNTDNHLFWAKERGMKTSGHALLYLNQWFAPAWRDQVNSTDEWWQLLDQHFKAIFDHYGGDISQWNLGNEFIWYDYWVRDNIPLFPKLNDPGTIRKLYNISRKYAQEDVMLIYNDQYVPSSYSGNHVFRDYLQLMRDYAASGDGFDAVGYQAHFIAHKSKTSFLQGDWAAGPNAFHMKELDKGLDSLSQFDVPVIITEFSPPSRDSRNIADYPDQPHLTDEYVAAWAKNFYTLAFSKSYVEEISCWFLVDGISGGLMDAGFVKKDGSVKPLYDTIKNLLKVEWNTEWIGCTRGSTNFRGFYGIYEVEIPGYHTEQLYLFRDSIHNPVVVMKQVEKSSNAKKEANTQSQIKQTRIPVPEEYDKSWIWSGG